MNPDQPFIQILDAIALEAFIRELSIRIEMLSANARLLALALMENSIDHGVLNTTLDDIEQLRQTLTALEQMLQGFQG